MAYLEELQGDLLLSVITCVTKKRNMFFCFKRTRRPTLFIATPIHYSVPFFMLTMCISGPSLYDILYYKHM